MNTLFEQILNIYKNMPLSRKIMTGVMILVVIAGFFTMFLWANKIEFQPLFTNLTPEDAAAITTKLQEKRIPYKIEGDGNVITVPSDKVYESRLSLAADGLPKGGSVGYEIFNESDFGTTEFVQKLNRQRALQGELARTIQAFDQVEEAKVMIVLPKESVFIEESKPSSASILLKLKSDLDEKNIQSIVHLVASSVEDLTPQRISIVDTTGRVLFKNPSEDEQAQKLTDERAKTQLTYKAHIEGTYAEQIQTMLERIVGKDNAIVRVSAEMDFTQQTTQEEIFDPEERNTPFVRSRKTATKNLEKQGNEAGAVSSVNPVVPPPGAGGGTQAAEKCESNDDTVNYELSKLTRQKVKPLAVLTKLSVAAVVNGAYVFETGKNGERTQKYVPRTDAEMAQFKAIVEKAMGYDENRGDQVTVESFPFSQIDLASTEASSLVREFFKEYGRMVANIVFVLILFFFVVRPLVKTVKEIQTGADEPELPLLGEDGLPILDSSRQKALPGMDDMPPREKAAYLAEDDVDRAANVLRGWLRETE